MQPPRQRRRTSWVLTIPLIALVSGFSGRRWADLIKISGSTCVLVPDVSFSDFYANQVWRVGWSEHRVSTRGSRINRWSKIVASVSLYGPIATLRNTPLYNMPLTLVDAAVCITAIFLLGLAYFRRPVKNHSNLPHPPGPNGLPILGNAFDIPRDSAWLTYKKWSIDYGPFTFHCEMTYGTDSTD